MEAVISKFLEHRYTRSYTTTAVCGRKYSHKYCRILSGRADRFDTAAKPMFPEWSKSVKQSNADMGRLVLPKKHGSRQKKLLYISFHTTKSFNWCRFKSIDFDDPEKLAQMLEFRFLSVLYNMRFFRF